MIKTKKEIQEIAKNTILWIDAYKAFHHKAYDANTTKILTNLTARSNERCNLKNSKGVYFFGIEAYIEEYINGWWEKFFAADKKEIIGYTQEIISGILGYEYDVSHLEQLHDHGKMPIEIRALKSGSFVPYGVPLLTIENTKPEFYWLPNFLETQILSFMWPITTAATTSYAFRQLFEKYAKETGAPIEFVDFQGHDFSSRGIEGQHAQMLIGMGHLANFRGTDNVAAVAYSKQYFKDLPGYSVAATEHSVMSSYGQENEFDCFKKLITKIQPTGIISIVSDTWDLWNVVENYLPKLKEQILARDGKVVIRPDSGDPVDIVAGTKTEKGLIEKLYDIFGGEKNAAGYIELNPKIGAINGDSITLEVAEKTLQRLKEKGFASSNIVFGIGAYTYQRINRDTHGMAFKATHIVQNDKETPISKNPKTCKDITKKSMLGLPLVTLTNKTFKLEENVSRETFINDENQELKVLWSK